MILKLADHESSTTAMHEEKQKCTILTGNSTCTNRQHLLNSSSSGQTAIIVIINVIWTVMKRCYLQRGHRRSQFTTAIDTCLWMSESTC